MEIKVNGASCDAIILSYRIGQSILTAEYSQSATSLYLFSSTVGVRPLSLKTLVRGQSRAECEVKISNIMQTLHGKNEIEIVGGNCYTAVLTSAKDPEPIGYAAMTAEYEFVAIAHGKEVIQEIGSGVDIVCTSTVPETACVLTITPAVDLDSVTVMGITVHNLTANSPVIIDGRRKLVTEDGVNKFADTDLISFPKLKPGANTITISEPTNVTVQLAYYPTYI